jgi:hypothetical protein
VNQTKDGSVKSIQDCEVDEVANLRRDASLEVVSSQVTEHSEKTARFSVVWLKKSRKEITLDDSVLHTLL